MIDNYLKQDQELKLAAFDRETERLKEQHRQRESAWQRALAVQSAGHARRGAAVDRYLRARAARSVLTERSYQSVVRPVQWTSDASGLTTSEDVELRRAESGINEADAAIRDLDAAVTLAQHEVEQARGELCLRVGLMDGIAWPSGRPRRHWPINPEPGEGPPDGVCTCRRDADRAQLELGG